MTPQEKYLLDQDEWLKTHLIQIGDSLLVLEDAQTDEETWQDYWDIHGDDFGDTVIYQGPSAKFLSLDCLHVTSNEVRAYPWFALKKL